MTSNLTPDRATRFNDGSTAQASLIFLICWVSLFAYGLVAAPIPGVNEPHYLCKARHFWQPDWCANDFFLASKNAHTVFYVTIGAITNFSSFEVTAIIGRLLATLVLTWGWMRCMSRFLVTAWGPLWSLWLFLCFTSCGNFSGEWLVGGVEGKVFSYGFLLLAYADVIDKRWNLAAVWTGLAISIHPIVGIWGLVAYIAQMVVGKLISLRRGSVQVETNRQPAWAYISPIFTLALAATPGLIPVVHLLSEQVTERTRYVATYIQVFFRLAHHLDPMTFHGRAYIGYAFLILIWIASLRWGGRTNSTRLLDRIVFWSIVFAVVGILIGLGPRPATTMPFYKFRMHLLKFYPFRLVDVLLPIVVAAKLIAVLERSFLIVPVQNGRLRLSASHFIAVGLTLLAFFHASSITESNRYSQEDRHDWLGACDWIRQKLPPDAVVYSPPNGWAFKWFAQRAEYVAFKDCPQDAAGIVKWNRRLNDMKKWFENRYDDEFYSADELHELNRETGITHILTDRLGPMEIEPLYRNETFQVYDIRASTAATQ
jgi:hypothetical protein